MTGRRPLSCHVSFRSPAVPTLVLGLLIGLVPGLAQGQQLPVEQQAALLLSSARAAYNEKNYPFAITRFRDYLAKFGNQKDTPAARYGLALALLELPEKDFNGAIEQLRPIADQKDFAEQPFVLYHLGLAQRGLGTRELMQAAAKPNEAPQRKDAARQRFEEAARSFQAAAEAFRSRVKPPTADAKALPTEQEWLARALCDQAEMLIRTGKAKEALALVTPLLADPVLSRAKARSLGLYYQGFANFLLHDYQGAGKSLNQLAPFSDPVFGGHARYLFARTLHTGDERHEATLQYDAVLKDFEQRKVAAVEALKDPTRFGNDADEKARLETLAKGPPPEYLSRAVFNLGVLLYENGKFGEALERFTAYPQQFPGSPSVLDAQLRQGFCQVQLRQYAEAIKTLQPVLDKDPKLNDQVQFWIGKAQVGAADPANQQAYTSALQTASNTLRNAADRANQQAGQDPEAKGRRGEALLELADVQQKLKQYREAANTFAQVSNEKLLPQRDEEILHQQLSALHLAGDYAAADGLCARFQQQYPKSTLLPAVLFRYAEDAYFLLVAADKNPNLPNRAAELAKLSDEVIKRYSALIEKYPENPQISMARFGLALVFSRKGEVEKARTILEAIPAPDRSGDLALVPYLLADCLIRTAPSKADDALAAGRLEEQLKAAAEQLEGFANNAPTSAEAPDALLKLGLCQQRLAALIAQPPERAKAVAAARATYERLLQQFPKSEQMPQAVFERAKCLAQLGDLNGCMNELRRFAGDPLKTTPVAPMADLHLALLLRGQNKPAEAVAVLETSRLTHENNLLHDPSRADWVPTLRLALGLSLKENGRFNDARNVFQQIMQQAPPKPEAVEASVRFGQSLLDEGRQKYETAQKKVTTPNLKPEETNAAVQAANEGLNLVRTAVQHLEQQAAQLKQKQPESESLARMLYDAAWGSRLLAEPEISAVRISMKAESLKQMTEAARKQAPNGPAPVVVPPEIPLAKVPLQPAEKKVRELYTALIAQFPALPLATEARFELAEMLTERDEHDAAVALLNAALDKEPPQELADKIHLRLGACEAAKGRHKEALAQFDAVAQNPKSVLIAQAHYRAGECLLQQGDFAKAAARFAIFRDQGPFQNVPNVTDRALLRLGHALAQQKQWEPSRQAFEQVVGRFPNSPWVNDARYGVAWALQNQQRFDDAVNWYTQIITATVEELAARAQLQIGSCRLEQKRYPEAATAFLVVPFTYEYPDLSAAALCEAARSFAESKQADQAEKLLQRVIKEHPTTKWAGVAKERLEALKKS